MILLINIQQGLSLFKDVLKIKSNIKQRNVLAMLWSYIGSEHLNRSGFFAATYLFPQDIENDEI